MPADRGRQFLLLTVAVTAAFYARTAVGPLQEAIRFSLSLSDNQMALLQGPALALPIVMAAIPLGLLIDRYSRVRLLLIFAVLDLIGGLLTALASDFALLFAARCLVGLTATATGTTAFSLLADLYLPAQRGRASTVVVIGQFGGMSAAFALGGALLTLSDTGPEGWRWALRWLTVPLAPVIFILLAMREPKRADIAVKNPSVREALVELWRYRAVVSPLVAGVVLIEMVLGAALTWAAPAFSRSFALPSDRVGAIMATGLMVSGILGPIAGGTLADVGQRTGGPRRTMGVLCGLSLLAVPAGLFAFASQIAAASVLLVLFMTIVSAVAVMGTVLFTIVIPNEVRGLCMAILFAACLLFGLGMAPVSVSLLSGFMGGPAMIGKALALAGMVASIFAAIFFALGRRSCPHTTL